jgi:hypothetical protein
MVLLFNANASKIMTQYLTFSQQFLCPSDNVLLRLHTVLNCTVIENICLYTYITFEDILSVVYFLRSNY